MPDETSTGDDFFNLLPDPRILPMLGEIHLQQWRCIAELIDNSVDAFLSAESEGLLPDSPEVVVSIPTSDQPSARITIRDNGPGMAPEILEKAVKAGWSGNDPITRLGLFGMGFNIATARLGTVTEVWTKRKVDNEWHGLRIDFDELQRQGHFRTPHLTRPETEPNIQGTEVTILNLKPEQRQWFSRPGNRTGVNKNLSRVYASMLRSPGVPIHFRLQVNTARISGRNHCIWGDEESSPRIVRTSRHGMIDAFQTFDAQLVPRPFCARCLQWLSADDSVCPVCGRDADILQRARSISGWLGIQRYLSGNEYGIDLLRHGRKIEIATKDLFMWRSEDTLEEEEEYPIDDPRHRGRIVGEVHIDHCRVSYLKDRFDRNDPAWDEMVKIVRGEGPLRPDKASQLGYGPNETPLYRLFQAFRRSSPKPKIAGCYENLLIIPDNDRAEEMARHFHDGEAEYRSDQKWFELAEEADRALLHPEPEVDTGASPEGFEDFGEVEEEETEYAREEEETPAEATRSPLPSLSREYFDDNTGRRWNVQAFATTGGDQDLDGGKPWLLKALPSGDFVFLVNQGHEVFQSVTLTPLDGLLAELAWSGMEFERGNPTGATYGLILSSLRGRFAGPSKLDPTSLSGEARQILTMVAGGLSRSVDSEDAQALFNELDISDREIIQQKMATRSVPSPQQVVACGRFLEYAPHDTVLRFYEEHPELFFDGTLWSESYSDLDYGTPAATAEAQSRLVRSYESLLQDAIWLAEQDPGDLADTNRAKLLRAAMALELLVLNIVSED